MSRFSSSSIRGVVVAVAIAAAVASSCAVPTVGLVSPYYGASAPSAPGSKAQTASLGFCSVAGGPVTLVVDVSNPDVNTELNVSIGSPGKVLRWTEDDNSQWQYFRGDQSHYELATVNELEPGQCGSVTITTTQFHSSDPAETRTFTYGVWW